jgi:hypothetical protein
MVCIKNAFALKLLNLLKKDADRLIMSEIKLHLIKQARELYLEIHPCSNKSELSDCFTTEGNVLMFWFNTNDSSTHVLATQLP